MNIVLYEKSGILCIHDSRSLYHNTYTCTRNLCLSSMFCKKRKGNKKERKRDPEERTKYACVLLSRLRRLTQKILHLPFIMSSVIKRAMYPITYVHT